MTGKTMDTLLQSLLIKKIEGKPEGMVTGLSYHTDTVTEGSLFFAIPGTRARGWEYAPAAVQKGALAVVAGEDAPRFDFPVIRTPDVRLASAVLAEAFYDYPSENLRLAGVTGTNGKTTTAYMIETLMSRKGDTTGLLGTVEYRIGPRAIKALSTTPEAVDLQKLFRDMIKAGVNYAVMEVSSHALEWHRVTGCDFDVAVLTNITADHLDFHQTFEAYRQAKTRLFTMPGSGMGKRGRSKGAVLNRDDGSYEYISDRVTMQKISYGIRNQADVMAVNPVVDLKGTSFTARTFAGDMNIKLKLRGMFNVYNALAAISTGLVEGLTLNEIKDGLESIQVIPGRFEQIECGQDFLVIVDYAHTADGLENILQTAGQLLANADGGSNSAGHAGRIITVFGCGGERDKTKRPLMGEIAARYSHYCIVTSDNPRGEDPAEIITDTLPGVKAYKNEDEYSLQADRYLAIEKAVNMAAKGDIVIIAGKGHEDYQIFKDRTISFDDRKVARELLTGRMESIEM